MRLVATSPSSQGDFRALLAISPLPSPVPIETQVGVVKLWAFNSSFQMSSIWSLWDYLAAIFDSGSGGLTWNHMNCFFFFFLWKKDFWLSKWCNKNTIHEKRFLYAPGFQESDNGVRTITLSSVGREFISVQVCNTEWIWRLSQLAVPTPSAPILPSVHLD